MSGAAFMVLSLSCTLPFWNSKLMWNEMEVKSVILEPKIWKEEEMKNSRELK